MVKVIALGEAMLRLTPKNYDRIEFCNEFELKIGGTEANFCIALKRLGIDTGWISKLPATPLGRRIENEIRRWGVDTSQVIWSSNYRVGIYYFERGSYPRPGNVIYDRKNSAFCFIEKNEVDWDYLTQADLFHTTGITLALSDKTRDVAYECLKFMNEREKLTSFDINYRSKLWHISKARNAILKVLKYVDILFTSEDDLLFIFGKDDLKSKCIDILNKYNLKLIIVTRGAEAPIAIDNNNNEYLGIGYRSTIIDRIGAGDAFDAGFIFGYLEKDIQNGLKYGEAMSALKFSIPGDFAILNKEEIDNFIKKGSSIINR
ncbi:MAG: sugar kinase [Candidatus Helarchaeota archaeon]